MNLYPIILLAAIFNFTIDSNSPNCENLYDSYENLIVEYRENVEASDGIRGDQFIEWGDRFWAYVDNCKNKDEVYIFSKKALVIYSHLNDPNLIESRLEELSIHENANLSTLDYWENILSFGSPDEENEYLKKLQTVAQETNNKFVEISALINVAKWYYENNYSDKSSGILFNLSQDSDITYANPYLAERMDELYESIGILKVGSRFPDFSFDLVNGNIFSDQDLMGNYTFIYFYGSTCGSCVSMYPKLNSIEQRYSDENFQVIGVGHDWQAEYGFNTKEEFNTFLERYDINWQQALKNQLWKEFNINRLSTGLLVNPEGVLVRVSNSDSASDYKNEFYAKGLEEIVKKLFD